jgi:DNA replication and repair protein RecF
MFLRELKLENFRLFSQINIGFSEAINIITGMNGEGKTSILESIYYAALTRSFRTSNDRQAVRYENEFLNIHTVFEKADGNKLNVRFFFSVTEGKNLFVDDKKVLKFSEYIGTVPCVVLTLEDLKLTFGGPVERRRFMDILLSQVSPLYIDHLKHYRRSLIQRNALLAQPSAHNIQNQLEIWNEKLVEHGTAIIAKRKDLVTYLNEHLGHRYNYFTRRKENISVRYRSTIDTDAMDITRHFIDRLKHSYEIERKRAMTVIGPHRDDLEFYKDGKSFKEFGSQGENKTLVIALKLTEWEFLTASRKTNPVLLLDDIFGELDRYRIQALVEVLKKVGQAFITTTMENFPFSGRKILVKEGRISHG